MISPPPQTSWQQQRWSPTLRRFIRVTFGVALLLGLGTAYSRLLLAPFAQPQVHVFVMSGEIPADVGPDALPSLRPSPGSSTLVPLVRSWTEAARLPEPQPLAGLSSGQTLDDLYKFTASAQIQPGDVMIGVVQSQLATIDDALYLVDRLNPRDPQHGRIPFEKFVEAFRTSTAGTTLICLDAGQLHADPRSGISVNDFGDRLRRAIEGIDDPRLWVLVSHHPGQSSQTTESHVPTVFLDAVSRGLKHEANRDGDHQISLGELVRFVQQATEGENHRTGATLSSQTAWLLHGGGGWTAKDLEAVLAPVSAPMVANPKTTVAHANEAPGINSSPPVSVPTAATVRPVMSMTVPALLNEAWELRDQLEQAAPNPSSLPLRPRDFAPVQWNRLLSELVQAETLWRCQATAFPARIHVLLQMRVNDLRALSTATEIRGSEWYDNIQQLRPQPAGDVNATVSLSMLEEWQRWTQDQPSEPELAERTTLQGFLAATDAQTFLKWVDSKPTHLHAELQFAGRLSSPDGREWPQIQQALRVRSIAEDLAGDPVAVRWFADDLLRADRLRWYGERKLSDPVQADDSATAHQTLREAEAIYHQAAAATERISAAQNLEADLLAALPHWMAFSRNPSLVLRASLCVELLPLMENLPEFIELLANTRAQDCGRIEQLRHGLRERRERITTLLFPQSLFGQFGLTEMSPGELRPHALALLETPLPTAPQRQLLQTFLARPPVTPAASSSEMATVDDPVATRLEPNAELETSFARLMQPLQRRPDADQSTSGRWAFSSTETVLPPGPEHADRSPAAAWCQAYVALPGALRKHLRDPSSVEDSATRAWRHTFWLVDPRDELPLVAERHLTAALLNDMQRVVHWQWQQATLAQSDTTTSESTRLQAQVDHLSSLLANSFGVSRPAGAKDRVLVSGPDSVDFATSFEQTLLLTVQNPQRTATRVRYVVEYDPQLLDVQTPSNHCQLATRVPRAESHIWPYDTDHSPEPMCELAAEGQDELSLKVRGRQSEGPSRLVVHVVTDRCSVRQEIVVNLPQRPLATVQVRASRNERLIVADQQLRPYANRSTAYHFSVQGLRKESHPLEITAYRVTVPTVSWPTATTLPTADLQRWMSQTAGIQELATLAGVAVKPDVSVPLRFPAVKPEANNPLDVSGGFLIVMHDAARQLSTWQHLACTPLRPAAYVDATVQYDESRETLRIAVRARDDLEIPAEGIPVRCRIVKHTDSTPAAAWRWESASAPSVAGMLQAYQREFVLNLPWRSPAEDAVVLIDVDDWHRAFVFNLNQARAQLSDNFAVEILAPDRRSAVRAPIAMIPVTVAVTIPAKFTTGENLIEVGVDRNGDRKLDDEPTLRLPADRQTGVVLESIDPTGIWTLSTSVRDWQVSVPTAGLADQWGTVLARVTHGPHAAWSEGTAVAFDKEGPRLSQINLSDNGEPAPAQPVRITARADDQGLSGVANVSAGIDLTGLGIIGPNTVMVPAKADSDDQWSVTLPTEKLTPGSYVVVMQATDLVGNAGPVSVVPLRCLTAEEVAARAAVPLQGQVQLSGEAIGDAEVRLTAIPPKDAPPTAPQTLTTKTNRSGQFNFESVAPGPYELVASGTVRGYRYESRTKVTVAPGTAAAPVQLVFGQKAR